MMNNKLIEIVKEKLLHNFHPLEIYLFGSYAWGCPNEESDLDLLIVVEKHSKNRHQTLVDLHKALVDIDIPKDILVYTKEEFDKYSKDITRFCYKVKHAGRKIYAKA